MRAVRQMAGQPGSHCNDRLEESPRRQGLFGRPGVQPEKERGEEMRIEIAGYRDGKVYRLNRDRLYVVAAFVVLISTVFLLGCIDQDTTRALIAGGEKV